MVSAFLSGMEEAEWDLTTDNCLAELPRLRDKLVALAALLLKRPADKREVPAKGMAGHCSDGTAWLLSCHSIGPWWCLPSVVPQ